MNEANHQQERRAPNNEPIRASLTLYDSLDLHRDSDTEEQGEQPYEAADHECFHQALSQAIRPGCPGFDVGEVIQAQEHVIHEHNPPEGESSQDVKFRDTLRTGYRSNGR
jgi:hypothetical protein